MKKVITKTALAFIFFFINQLHSQNKVLYYDQNKKLISKEEFDKVKTGGEFIKNYYDDKDSNQVAMIFRVDEYGKISDEQHHELLEYVKKLSNTDIDEQCTIVICFFFKPYLHGESAIKHQTSVKEYSKYFRKNKKIINLFVTENGYSYKNKNVFEDKDDKIKKWFFNYPFDSGNYLIIKPDGHFKRHLSEYNYEHIIKYLEYEN